MGAETQDIRNNNWQSLAVLISYAIHILASIVSVEHYTWIEMLCIMVWDKNHNEQKTWFQQLSRRDIEMYMYLYLDLPRFMLNKNGIESHKHMF